MEDFVTWVDSSKIKQHVMNYNDEVSEHVDATLNTSKNFEFDENRTCKTHVNTLV